MNWVYSIRNQVWAMNYSLYLPYYFEFTTLNEIPSIRQIECFAKSKNLIWTYSNDLLIPYYAIDAVISIPECRKHEQLQICFQF